MSRIRTLLAALCCALLIVPLPAPALAAGPEPQIDIPVVSFSAGLLHSAFIREDGSLWTVGSNAYGQLGTGVFLSEQRELSPGEDDRPADSLEPVKVMDDVRAVFAGNLNTFAITSDGTLYGWGCNDGSLLGLGDNENRELPVKILSDVVTAAAGRFHTAAVTADGVLLTWGWNYSGQLGLGSTETMTTPTQALSGVRSVAVGYTHTLAVMNDDTLWAAGDNSYGQLCNGSTEELHTFRRVMENVQSAACTAFGSLILKTDGTLWACGYNALGDLGSGSYQDLPEPVQILEHISAVTCSKDHGSEESFSAALSQDGVLYGWGSNSYRQYGQEARPAPVKTAEGVTAMSAGGGHLLYLREDGALLAVGNNETGQLGNGTLDDSAEPVLLAEKLFTTPKGESSLPLILTVVGIVLAIAGLFAYLIVRTLKGEKPKASKKKQAAKPKPEKKKKLTDRELIRLAKEMEHSRKESESRRKDGKK